MKILKCENGHYFDNDAYTVCPLCGAEPAGKADDKKRVVFGKPAREEKVVSRREKPADESVTVALVRGNLPNRDDRQAAAPAPAPAPAPQPVPAPQPATEQPQGLQDAIRQASATSEGKTLSYFSSMAGAAAGTAIAQAETSPVQAAAAAETPAETPAPAGTPVDPVAGWLVCIGGPHLCETLPIHVGLNSIGRSATNRMVLAKDPSVSREKHAFITFEPKFRQFYVRPGDSSGLTYLNGQYIYETKTLAAKDVIEIGHSKFYFLPLCGEDFSWEEYLN